MKAGPDHWYDLVGRPLTRRDLLRVGRDLAACVALSALPGEGAQDTAQPTTPFLWGVASGDPAADGMVLWTRVVPAAGNRRSVSVRWEISENERFSRIVRRGSSLAPAQLGHSVHAEVAGLRPDREYWYRFIAAGHTSTVGRTRTAPVPSASLDELDFAFASCQNYEHGYFTAFRHLAQEDIDFLIHLGDYIYEKRFSPNLTVREIAAGEVFTLRDYRDRYALYRTDADLQASHAACAWIVTTDDHEVANNYAGAIPERPVPRSEFLLRRAAAYQAYYEFMPLRRTSMPSGPGMQLFRRLRFGNLADFHVLDTRQYRSDQACGDGRKARCPESLAANRTLMGPVQERWLERGLRSSRARWNVLDTRQYRSDQACGDGRKARCPESLAANRTMMGPVQERWLERGLRSSRARWNVLANQVMVTQTKVVQGDQELFGMDRWDGYPAAQQRLLRLLASARRANPVVITGDVHSNWVADLKENYDNASSAVVSSEFVGTSITSGGDGSDAASPALKLNPHLKFFNNRRGYVRVTLTPARWRADYRVVPYVSKPDAPIETRSSWTVAAGTPGAEPA